MVKTSWSSLILISFFSFVLLFSLHVENAEAGSSGALLLGCCSTVPGGGLPTPGSCIGCPDGLDCARDQSLCLEDGGSFLAGGSCEEIGPEFTCLDPGNALGCCVIPAQNNCRNGQTLIECQESSGGTEWVAGALCEVVDNCENGPVGSTNVPTLSEWGFIALAGILGVIGLIMVIRKRKATA